MTSQNMYRVVTIEHMEDLKSLNIIVSLIYGFWLPIWHLQTLLEYHHDVQFFHTDNPGMSRLSACTILYFHELGIDTSKN
jgi:hypothetical protein